MHIVDELIYERAEKLISRPWLWKLLKPNLYKMLGYKGAVAMADAVKNLSGRAAFSHMANLLSPAPQIKGLGHIPETGAVIIIANHPTGLADGVFVYEALKDKRPDHIYLANADALRVVPKCEDIIIPVEWVKSKRTRDKTKATLRALNQAISEERAVVIFPSGALAELTFSGLKDRPWNPTAVSIARKRNVPIVPLHIRARNSALYYVLSLVHNELRDITLFHELLNKKGYQPIMIFGNPIRPDSLPKGGTKATAYIRSIVERLK